MYCRRLEAKDYAATDQLIRTRTTFVGIPRDQVDWVQRIQEQTSVELLNLLEQAADVCSVFGAFEDETEIKMLGALVTFQSPHQACWMIRTAYVAPGAPFNTISLLLGNACQCYEVNGIARFLAMYTEESWMKYSRLNKQSPIMHRYIGQTEFTLKANTRPRFLDYWEYLYGRILMPCPTVVRSFTLVDESTSTLATIAPTDYTYRPLEQQQV